MPDDAEMARQGLVAVASSNPLSERFLVGSASLTQFPFFRVLHAAVDKVLDEQSAAHGRLSYVIWGGVATNLALYLTGRCRVHYSFHDVELLLTRGGRIYHSESLVGALRLILLAEKGLSLDVGGLSVARMKQGTLIEDFQRDRSLLRDGDLLLNNIVLMVGRDNGELALEGPVGTLRALVLGDAELAMRDASGLRSVDRISRRVYRTVSKAIRFEHVAGLSLSESSRGALTSLVDAFTRHLEALFQHPGQANQEWVAAHAWLQGAQIQSVEGGGQWLFEKVVSETAMRLAGLQGLSVLDKAAFEAFVLGAGSGLDGVCDHPLVQLVGRLRRSPELTRLRSSELTRR